VKEYRRPRTQKRTKISPEDHDYREGEKFKVQMEAVFNAIPETGSIKITELKNKGIEDRDLWTILTQLQNDERIRFDRRVVGITRFSRELTTVDVGNMNFNVQIEKKSILPNY